MAKSAENKTGIDAQKGGRPQTSASAKEGLLFSFTAHPQSAIMPQYEKKFITSAAA
jgi:hypothetical protein